MEESHSNAELLFYNADYCFVDENLRRFSRLPFRDFELRVLDFLQATCEQTALPLNSLELLFSSFDDGLWRTFGDDRMPENLFTIALGELLFEHFDNIFFACFTIFLDSQQENIQFIGYLIPFPTFGTFI